MPFAPKEMTLDTAKGFVDRLMRSQKKSSPTTWPPKRAAAQETVAHMLGFPNWHAMHATLSDPGRHAAISPSGSVAMGPVILGCDHYSVIAGQSSKALSTPDTFTWSDPNEVVSIIGSARDRFMVINDVRGRQRRPVLWLRSNLAYDPATHTPGYGFMPANGYELHGILNRIFQSWRPEEIVAVLMSLVVADEDEDASMWKSRARHLISVVVSSLVYLRDHHQVQFDCQVLRDKISLPGVTMLVNDTRLPPEITDQFMGYGRSLSLDAFPHELTTTALDQHGYLQMQFTRILAAAVDLAPPLVFAPVQILALNEVEGLPPGASIAEHLILLATYIHAWIKENPGGVLVFDGLVPDSPVLGLLEWSRDEWSGAHGVHLLQAASHPHLAPKADHVLTVFYQP